MHRVSGKELEEHALDYRPVNQPQDEQLRFLGVLRSAAIEYEQAEVAIQVLVVKSRPMVKLYRDRRPTYLNRLTGRLEEVKGLLNTRRDKGRDCTWSQIEKARRGNRAESLVDVRGTRGDGNLELAFQLNEERLAQAEVRNVRYLLGTHDFDPCADEMLTPFKKQKVVERPVKVVKGPIRVRRIFLHEEGHVEGLIFVAMLALLVYATVEMLSCNASQWMTILQMVEKFELLGAVCLRFGDVSVLKLTQQLNCSQR